MRMTTAKLGKTLVIANPTAHSGKSAQAAEFVRRFLDSYGNLTAGHDLVMTKFAGHATQLAAAASDFDTVIALGGDGIIHEIVNGLMQLPSERRPRMAIVPMGTGNDFARTLHMARNDPKTALAQIARGEERTIDLGCVNGVYFMQTLSFGLDAAIALDTTRRRQDQTSQQGTALFVTSGLKIFSTGLRGWPFQARVDGEPISGTDVVFAVQNGPTYGAGFRVCPDASPADGRLDLCYSTRKPSNATVLALFGLARYGKHTRSRNVAFRKVQHLDVRFPGADQPSCQVDGERLEADGYSVDVVPAALRVIVPPGCAW
jgi:YegS/Rv2252/BmrU family lipid kinase